MVRPPSSLSPSSALVAPSPGERSHGPADVVLRFLESVSTRSETDFYLGLFRALPKERFAAICVGEAVALHAAEAVVLDLRFLAALGLSPVVVLGLFDGEGDRAGRASLGSSETIAAGLARESVACTLLDAEAPDLAATVALACREGTIPLVAFSRGDGALATPDERVGRLGALLAALATRKVIFLERAGGLAGREVVNLTVDYEACITARDLAKHQRMLVVHSRRLVFDLAPHRLLVAITSPLDLLRELFTVKGAGTLLRRGATVLRHDRLDGIDRGRLAALIEKSFGRPVREGFFERFDREGARVYREESFRGAGLVTRTPLGGYLTKFAVEREAQGEGIGRDLWDAIAAEQPALFWRARGDNPIASWYTRLCHGLVRQGDWTVYFRGLAPTDIPAAIDYALAQPVDLPPVAG